MSPLPSLIFDLDGTLIDSVPDLMAAVNRMLVAEGRQTMVRAEVQSYVGDGAPALVRRVMAARSLSPERHAELTDGLVSDYTARSSELTRVYPDVANALAALRQRGHPLGICTNKPGAATKAVLKALGLDGYFDAVIAGDSLPEKKPHPAPLQAVASALGSSAIYIGDSEVDARTAEAADLPFLLYSEGYLRVPLEEIRVTHVFRNFAELPDIVARMSCRA
ncbi:phosphoglycolate phosphatase [Defluviimonas aestuarii]|uniref:phosphoglycolate phosphatase n=1 Tax=Albidovulum aestuarii TaxID=1130726 RepID=UPI00249A7A1E|nr:phosphoglycolate phosphatase [Defluviimonas aestuarii]MDI3337317.1 phosphoglycolate phosphatase [Defluviimonas aestuarii]